MNEVEIKRVFITPDKAKEYLVGNKNNRKIDKHLVRNYVNQMRKGQWMEDTGDTISISPNGRLLNGQHRLTAIAEFGQGYHFLVASNIDEAAFAVFDTGKKRTAADALYTAGIPNATGTASGITTFLILKDGKVINGRRRTDMGVTNEDVMAEYNKRPSFWNTIVHNGRHFYKEFSYTLPPSTIIGWYALFSDINTIKADTFMTKLCTGVGFSTTTDPIRQLRSILEKSKSSRNKLTQYYRTAYIIKAWNYFLSGKEIRLLTFDTKEVYPKLNMTPLVNITNDDALATV